MISLLQKLKLKYPIIQAPMAGAASKNLVCAVSQAGALGSFGAGYLSAKDIRKHILFFKQHCVDKPFNINLFIPPTSPIHYANYTKEITNLQNFLQPVFDKFDLIPNLNLPETNLFEQQIEVLLEEKIPVLSFTFGALDPALIQAFKKNNTLLIGTATCQKEALILQDLNCDAIVAQGEEAGGHRGSFNPLEPVTHPLIVLLKSLERIIHIPVIAAGGIMNGQDIACALKLGAQMVQMGSAFLVCAENDAIPNAYKQALIDNPVIASTSAISGRAAQGIQNELFRLMEEFEKEQSKTGQKKLPYPISHFLTANLRKKSAEQNNFDYIAAWAGRKSALARSQPVKKLLETLETEYLDARQHDKKHRT